MPLPMYGKTSSKKGLNSIKCTLAVASGKGGVGKSTVAVNLALALKALNFRVGLLDTDIYGPSVRKMLPEDKMPGQIGERMSPAMSQGIHLMSMAYFRQENEAAVIRAPIANSVIAQFVHQVNWGELDYLIVDFPPGTGDVQLTLCQQANIAGAVMVTTPQEIALMDVRKSMHLFNQVKIPVLGVIENMCGLSIEGSGQVVYPFGKGGGEKLAREAGVPFLGAVPLDPVLCQKSDSGQSIFAEKTHTAQIFLEFANTLNEHVNALNHSDIGAFELEWKDMPI